MQQPQPDSAGVLHYHCPSCGEMIPALAGERLIVCPRCGEQSFIPDESPQATEPAEPQDPAESSAAPEPELSELRIKQISNLKRGAYRNRSWCVVGAVACLVGAAQLVQMTVQEARHGGILLPIGFCFAAAAALLGSGYFIRSALLLTREIRTTFAIPEPTTPPDFSTLSDGSQQWKNLSESSDAER